MAGVERRKGAKLKVKTGERFNAKAQRRKQLKMENGKWKMRNHENMGMFTTEHTENTEVKPESVNVRGYTAYIH